MKDARLINPAVLRIAVLGSTYPRSADDHEVPWLRESVKRLAARGHIITVIAPAYRALKDHEIDGVRVCRFRYAPARWEMLTHGEGAPNKLRKNPILKVLTLTYILSGIWFVWKICRQGQIEVLHVHWPFPHGVMALLPAWLGGVKIVSSCHGAEFALAASGKLSTRLHAFCLRKSDAITANSAYTAKLIADVSQETAKIIPWGVTVTTEPGATPAECPLLLFSGRLIERKGVNFLLRAMPFILAQRKVRLVITGDGHCRAMWEELARELGLGEAVAFAGFVSNEELSSLFRACSIYVHPAIYDSRGDTEGLGVVLVEALANRKPVVASAVGGIVDVIKDGETGLLVPEKDPEAIAKAVLHLLENPDYAKQLGEQGWAYAMSYFNWDRIIDQYEEIYHQCVLSGGRRSFPTEDTQPITT